jgi:hypothetical protein
VRRSSSRLSSLPHSLRLPCTQSCWPSYLSSVQFSHSDFNEQRRHSEVMQKMLRETRQSYIDLCNLFLLSLWTKWLERKYIICICINFAYSPTALNAANGPSKQEKLKITDPYSRKVWRIKHLMLLSLFIFYSQTERTLPRSSLSLSLFIFQYWMLSWSKEPISGRRMGK